MTCRDCERMREALAGLVAAVQDYKRWECGQGSDSAHSAYDDMICELGKARAALAPASEPPGEGSRTSEFRRGVEACIAAIECMTPRGDPPGMGVHRPLVQNHVADRIEASLRHLLDAPASEPQAVPAPVNTPPVDEDAVERVATAIELELNFDPNRERKWLRDAARAAIAALGDPEADVLKRAQKESR